MSKWRFTIPRADLVRHVAQRRSHAEIGRLYGVDRSRVTRAIQALSQEELAAATLQAMSVRTPERPLVRPEAALESVDAAELLLHSLRGIQRIQRAFEGYIAQHEHTLSAKRHRGALGVYFEAVKTLAKAVHELVATQAKLSEWVGAEELRRLVVTTFDRLPARLTELNRPVTPLEAAELVKALYLEEFQGRIVLLRQSRHRPDSGDRALRQES